jgi:glycosyltransferase involved in cell wall biosynthesis
MQRRALLKRISGAFFERNIIEAAKALHFLNRAELKGSKETMGCHYIYFIVPNGVDLEIANGISSGQFRTAYPQLHGKKIILFLGRLHWIKDLSLQLKAVSLLVHDHPDLMWVLIGPDDGEWPRLKREISSKNLASHVLWTGSLKESDCFKALADADVFVQTSYYECHSMAVNEALAIGTPLVITDTVHFTEVEESGAGRVVPAAPQQIAEAINEVLCSADKSKKMRIAARQLATDHYAWSKVAEAMVSAYRKLLGDQDLSGHNEEG